ncbi:CBS domain-containing protein [Candidatus Bathyarchaeota archaeon]|nr:CBS domain-containing protein [Candidatus Bathyarchaeota archaeon]
MNAAPGESNFILFAYIIYYLARMLWGRENFMHEEPKRSVLKAVSWRIIATLTGMFLVLFFTGQPELMASFGVGDVVLKLIFYYSHERVWNSIKYGKNLGGKVTIAMRSPPVTSLQSDTVSSIVQTMVTSDTGGVIVVDGDKPVGMITERDILERVLKPNKDSTKTLAKDIMSSSIITIKTSESITDALKIMSANKIRRLAVTQDEKVIGIVTMRRILEAYKT